MNYTPGPLQIPENFDLERFILAVRSYYRAHAYQNHHFQAEGKIENWRHVLTECRDTEFPAFVHRKFAELLSWMEAETQPTSQESDHD